MYILALLVVAVMVCFLVDAVWKYGASIILMRNIDRALADLAPNPNAGGPELSKDAYTVDIRPRSGDYTVGGKSIGFGMRGWLDQTIPELGSFARLDRDDFRTAVLRVGKVCFGHEPRWPQSFLQCRLLTPEEVDGLVGAGNWRVEGDRRTGSLYWDFRVDDIDRVHEQLSKTESLVTDDPARVRRQLQEVVGYLEDPNRREPFNIWVLMARLFGGRRR